MQFFDICADSERETEKIANESMTLWSQGRSTDYEETPSDVQSIINKYVIPLVGMCGVILNLCGVATVVHMGMNTSSMVYMLVLAVTDLISGFLDAIIVVGLVRVAKTLETWSVSQNILSIFLDIVQHSQVGKNCTCTLLKFLTRNYFDNRKIRFKISNFLKI